MRPVLDSHNSHKYISHINLSLYTVSVLAIMLPREQPSRGKHWNAFLLSFVVGLSNELVFVVRVHTPVASLPKAQTFSLAGSLHKVLVQGKVVTN